MSRKSSEHDYTLRSMTNLMGERRKKAGGGGDDSGERTLITAPSNTSLTSLTTSASSRASSDAACATPTGDLERAARKNFQRDGAPAFVRVLAVLSALGGFLSGYDAGVVSGAMLLLKREQNITLPWHELLVSGTVAAAALSALAGAFLNDVFGRRTCVLLASCAFFIGGIVMGSAPNKEAVLIGRLIVGIGIGKKRCVFVYSCVRGTQTSSKPG